MQLLETPDDRFDHLPDFPWPSARVQVDPNGAHMAFIDEGPRDAPLLLFLHGEPTWAYLYRHMIRGALDRGYRVVAPDLIGFGRSSKPTRVADHTYARHVDWVTRFLQAQELRHITLFAQDWGSLIGLRLVGENPHLFDRVIIGNGFLPAGEPLGKPGKISGNMIAFIAWRTFALYSPIFRCSRIVDFGSAHTLTPHERRAYDAPFPSRRYLAGPRAMPALVPLRPTDPARPANLRAWQSLERFDKPFLTLFSTGDPIMRGLDRVLQRRIPGAADQPHTRVRGGHFLQEDSPTDLIDHIDSFVRQTSA